MKYNSIYNIFHNFYQQRLRAFIFSVIVQFTVVFSVRQLMNKANVAEKHLKHLSAY